jgi:hypothetical protein
MSAVAVFFIFGVVAAAPASTPSPQPVSAMDVAAETDRTPMRCKPAPYYVADQAAAERPKVERQWVTGSRVPLTARDYPDRRARPCFLMRDGAPANPLRPAD